jgi:hypothetical protein
VRTIAVEPGQPRPLSCPSTTGTATGPPAGREDLLKPAIANKNDFASQLPLEICCASLGGHLIRVNDLLGVKTLSSPLKRILTHLALL